MLLIKIIVGLIHYRMDEIKSKLEDEDKAEKLGNMQGELRGLKALFESIQENLTLFDFWEPIRDLKLYKYKTSSLKLLSDLVLAAEEDSRWGSVSIMKNSTIDEMKDFLMDQAKKPRDLYICHGKAKGLRLYTRAFNDIKHAYESRLKEEQRQREEEPLIDLIESEEEVIVEVLNEEDIENLDDLIDLSIAGHNDEEEE
jgi:hypothetical protein